MLQTRLKVHPISATDSAWASDEALALVPTAPPTPYDLDRLNYHIELQEFSRGLQNAANAVFLSDNTRRSRYTKVIVLLLSWEDEDPQLPVSLEIGELKDVLVGLYGFEVEEWHIPSEDSHMELNMRILQFLKDSTSKDLKIVYYAGHGKLSTHGQAIWTSHRNSSGTQGRYPTVKWSGIQNALEESPSDVLVLLDCCASGVSNTDEGNGVTELIAACAFNNTANGVGAFSFTHALITQLRKLVQMPSFTVGYLYNLIFADIQGLRVEAEQRKKAPIHLVLTQDHRLPRSITLSAKRSLLLSPFQPSLTSDSESGSAPTSSESHQSSSSTNSVGSGNFSPSGNDTNSSASSLSQLPEYPRLLFSIRISEDIKPRHLSTELFSDWLATLPVEAKAVRVEAGFSSDSTIIIASMPIALIAYLPQDPAIIMLGTSRSGNLMIREDSGKVAENVVKPWELPDAFQISLSGLSDYQDDVSFATSPREPWPAMKFAKGRSKCVECVRVEAFCQLGTLSEICIRCQSHGLSCNYGKSLPTLDHELAEPLDFVAPNRPFSYQIAEPCTGREAKVINTKKDIFEIMRGMESKLATLSACGGCREVRCPLGNTLSCRYDVDKLQRKTQFDGNFPQCLPCETAGTYCELFNTRTKHGRECFLNEITSLHDQLKLVQKAVGTQVKNGKALRFELAKNTFDFDKLDLVDNARPSVKLSPHEDHLLKFDLLITPPASAAPSRQQSRKM